MPAVEPLLGGQTGHRYQTCTSRASRQFVGDKFGLAGRRNWPYQLTSMLVLKIVKQGSCGWCLAERVAPGRPERARLSLLDSIMGCGIRGTHDGDCTCWRGSFPFLSFEISRRVAASGFHWDSRRFGAVTDFRLGPGGVTVSRALVELNNRVLRTVISEMVVEAQSIPA